MVVIDGSEGEGGGQILRSALSLAVCTRQAFRIEHIRARREKPGLLRQHVTAVKAAAAISDARVEGCEVGSSTLTFEPGALKAGEHSFNIGTAGSCTLVLQTVLIPLLTAAGSSTIRISGGTHNTAAPPFDFLSRAFMPLIARMGARVELVLERHGFYPRGGGSIVAHIEPAARLTPVELVGRGAQRGGYAEAYISAIPLHVAERELAVVARRLKWEKEQLKIRGLPGEVGPGNVLSITLEFEHVTEVFTGFGERGRSAESVAEETAREARAYLERTAPVGAHLADQLLLPMAFGGVRSFVTCEPTPHFKSNCEVIAAFTGKRIGARREEDLHVVAVA
ncbi:MAG TPA: RNA 3'-terminal phosphate cyclase [Gammaproteobacteria bacterium]